MTFPAITTEGPQNTLNWAFLSSYLLVGKGNPEGTVKGRIGAIFLRVDGTPGKTIYVKGEGEGTTNGWEAFEGSKGGGFATIKEVVEEAEKRAAADAVLSGLISAEEAARITGDNTLTTSIATEKTSRESADATEKAERIAADSAEKSSRESADNERIRGPNSIFGGGGTFGGEGTFGETSVTDTDIVVWDGISGTLVKDGGNFETRAKAIRLDQFAVPTSNVSFGEKKITKLADPTEALDGANKEYVDAAAAAAAAGLSIKAPVSYATASALENATSVGALFIKGTCPLTIDGVTAIALATRILIKNSTTEPTFQKNHGIYGVAKNECFGGEGSFGGEGEFGVGNKWELTRTTDADTTAEVVQGMFVLVTKGTTNAATTWILTSENPIEIGTTPEIFAQFTATPVGAAGGDLTGTFPNPTIAPNTVMAEDLKTEAKRLFPQLVAALIGADHKENFGIAEVEKESTLEVTHGLGAEPTDIHLTPELNEAISLSPTVRTKSATKFTIGNTSAKKIKVNWRAIT